MSEERFTEAELWADDPDAWKEPARCDDWITIMQEITDNPGERPEDRAEAERLIARLEAAKRGPQTLP